VLLHLAERAASTHYSSNGMRLRDNITILPLHTSARTPQFLIQDGNGKRFQASKALVDLIHAFQRYPDEPQSIADELSVQMGVKVSSAEAGALIEKFLKPLMVSEDAGARDNSAGRSGGMKDGLLLKFSILPEKLVGRITRVTSGLYRGSVVVAMVLFILLGHMVTYHHLIMHGVFGGASRLSGFRYLTAYLLIMIVILWHEVGHASALRRFGAVPGSIGFGLYVTFPVMYSDVSDSWRLPGRQRAVVDVGGMYFQAMLIPLFALLYLWLRDPLLLLVNCSNEALILFSLNPLLKFDGYWIFADLIGLPNLRTRSMRLLFLKIRGALREKWRRAIPDNLNLTRPAAIMVCAYGAVSFAFFFIALFLGIRFMPRLVVAYVKAIHALFLEFRQLHSLSDFAADANLLLKAFFQTMPMVGVVLMARNLLLMLYQIGKKLFSCLSKSQVIQRIWFAGEKNA
jgi:putative peptide zinc metalloprotease protein